MKRITAALMALVLVLTQLPISATAADVMPEIALSAVPSITSGKAGDAFEVVIKMDTEANLTSMTFNLNYDPEVFEIDKGSSTSFSAGISALDSIDGTWVNNSSKDGVVNCAWFNFGQVNASGKLLKVKMKIKESAIGGNYSITLAANAQDFACVGDVAETVADKLTIHNGNISVAETVREISTLDVTLAAPALGEAPQRTVSGPGFQGTVSWSPEVADSFLPNTSYTAAVSLTPSDKVNGPFAADAAVSLNGSQVKDASVKEDAIAFTQQFPKTSDKLDVSSDIILESMNFPYDSTPQYLPEPLLPGESGSWLYTWSGTVNNGNTYGPTAAQADITAGAPTDAGRYTLLAQFEGPTAKGSATATLTIDHAPVEVVSYRAVDRAYDGTVKVALADIILGDGIFEADESLVSLSTCEGYVTDKNVTGSPVPIQVVMRLGGARGHNYSLALPSGTSVTITAADYAFNSPADQNIMVGSGSDAIATPLAVGTGVEVDGVNEQVPGTFAWYTDSNCTNPVGSDVFTGLTVEDSVPLYWCFVPQSANYVTKTGSAYFTIVDGAPQRIAFETPGPVAATYLGEGFTNQAVQQPAEGGTGTGAITYRSSNPNVADVDNNGTVVIRNAGEAVITATAAAVPGQWAEASASYTIVVSPARYTIDDIDFTLPQDAVYVGYQFWTATAQVDPALVGAGTVTDILFNGYVSYPISAGSYEVTAVISGGSNYHPGAVSLGSFTIAPKALSDDMLTLQGSYIYNGSAQRPQHTVHDGETALNPSDYSIASAPQTHAGTYTFTVSGTGNYTGSASADYTIERLEPTADKLSVSGVVDRIYSGSGQTVSVSAVSGYTGLGTVTIRYNGSTEAPVNAGHYTVTADIAQGTNFTALSGLELGSFEIALKAMAGRDGQLKVRAGQADRYTFRLTELLPPDVPASQISGYTVAPVSSPVLSGQPTEGGGTLTIPVSGDAAGGQTVQLTIGFVSANYTITNATLTVSVSDKTVVNIGGVSLAGRQYNGTPLSYNAGGITFTDEEGNAVTGLTPSFTWSTGSAPVDAGSYTLTVSADGGDEYTVNAQVLSAVITRVPVTLQANSASVTVGGTMPTLTFTALGLVGGDSWADISAEQPVILCDAADTTTSGSYAITISGGLLNQDAGANYLLAGYVPGTLTINAAAATGGSDVPPVIRPTESSEEEEIVLDDALSGGGEADTPDSDTPDSDTPDSDTPDDGATVAAWVSPFTDVTSADWFFDDVAYAVTEGLFNGTSATTFSPNTQMSRGMLVTVLWRMDGSPDVDGLYADFADVAQGSYYESAIGWAAKNGIVTGYGEGFFGPDDNVSREQLATILWRFAQYKGIDVSTGEDSNILSFKDATDITEYAIPAMQWACSQGIITGKPDEMLDPKGSATRAEAAAMLRRLNEG